MSQTRGRAPQAGNTRPGDQQGQPYDTGGWSYDDAGESTRSYSYDGGPYDTGSFDQDAYSDASYDEPSYGGGSRSESAQPAWPWAAEARQVSVDR